jgi:hypothetical protein
MMTVRSSAPRWSSSCRAAAEVSRSLPPTSRVSRSGRGAGGVEQIVVAAAQQQLHRRQRPSRPLAGAAGGIGEAARSLGLAGAVRTGAVRPGDGVRLGAAIRRVAVGTLRGSGRAGVGQAGEQVVGPGPTGPTGVVELLAGGGGGVVGDRETERVQLAADAPAGAVQPGLQVQVVTGRQQLVGIGFEFGPELHHRPFDLLDGGVRVGAPEVG